MQIRRRRLVGGGIVLAVGIAAAVAAYAARYELFRIDRGLPPYRNAVGTTEHVRIEADDGVGLATRVHLPEGDGPWPAVLIRNPYPMSFEIDFLCRVYTRYGLACVAQDVRGRNDSEGDWEPLVHEPADGLRTIRWMTEQPWLDGRIALYGPSYLAAVQWAVADRLPPEVVTIVPLVYGTDAYAAAYQGGMFRHEVLTAWAAGMPDTDERHAEGYSDSLGHRPHAEVDRLYFGGRPLPWYQEWIHGTSPDDDVWQRPELRRFRSAPERTAVPVLAVGGWFDVFLPGQIADYERLASRARSKLVIGPWTHGLTAMGDIDYPGDDDGLPWRLTLDWMLHHLRDEPLAMAPTGYTTYAMREGRWRDWERWPPETELLRLWLTRASEAGSCSGGGLEATPSPHPESITYRYDPDEPVPTRGGSAMLAYLIRGFVGQLPGSRDQEGLCEREDVVTFVSEPLTEPLHLAGRAAVHLTVASDAPDTAFAVKLIEITPTGTAVNVRDTITSLSFGNESRHARSYTPGEPVELRIELWPTEWRLPAGSRLRLDVSSSNFPAYHAHTNRAGPWAVQVDAVPAVQTLHTGADRASFVELPIWRAPDGRSSVLDADGRHRP